MIQTKVQWKVTFYTARFFSSKCNLEKPQRSAITAIPLFSSSTGQNKTLSLHEKWRLVSASE